MVTQFVYITIATDCNMTTVRTRWLVVHRILLNEPSDFTSAA